METKEFNVSNELSDKIGEEIEKWAKANGIKNWNFISDSVLIEFENEEES